MVVCDLGCGRDGVDPGGADLRDDGSTGPVVAAAGRRDRRRVIGAGAAGPGTGGAVPRAVESHRPLRRDRPRPGVGSRCDREGWLFRFTLHAVATDDVAWVRAAMRNRAREAGYFKVLDDIGLAQALFPLLPRLLPFGACRCSDLVRCLAIWNLSRSAGGRSTAPSWAELRKARPTGRHVTTDDLRVADAVAVGSTVLGNRARPLSHRRPRWTGLRPGAARVGRRSRRARAGSRAGMAW